MSSGNIPGGPKRPGMPPGIDATPTEPQQTAEKKSDATTEKKGLDKFERASQALGPKLQPLAGKLQVKFTNEELAYLAGQFATIIAKHGGASRKKRAQLFTKAILKRRSLRKLFSGVSDADMEGMYEAIAAQLDGSPVFAQLIEDVTDEARKQTG